jgi:hypothetical protein
MGWFKLLVGLGWVCILSSCVSVCVSLWLHGSWIGVRGYGFDRRD